VRDRRPPNDPGLYDDLAEEWWKPRGAFAPLHWLAAARGALLPLAQRPGSVLLDLACGGGLLAPHVRDKGHRHLGVDVGVGATRIARTRGVDAVRGDVASLPLATGSVDVVVAGEIFEHVADLGAVLDEVARVLRPGGVLVCDTLADTRRCSFLLVTLGERLPVVPRGIHDPRYFVGAPRLQRLCRERGIDLAVRGVRPRVAHVVAWLLRRREDVGLRPVRSTGIVYQGIGVKA
jgi:2-polyprenyl-6-hydroxyphenyl methylase/3-demethylubiquinone-9 3-methyltransferase